MAEEPAVSTKELLGKKIRSWVSWWHRVYFYFFNKVSFIYLYIYFWLCWVFVAAHGLSIGAASWGYSSLWCAGFSLQWLLLSWSTGSGHTGFSGCGTGALEGAGFSSCGARAYLICSIRDLPGPGIEPVSPALAGGFLTTVPPGKSLWHRV